MMRKEPEARASSAVEGRRRIAWAERSMPVLRIVRDRFTRERPLEGHRIAACLHVTPETANLVLTLKAAGADVALCASNPLSTQDDVVASLSADFNVPTHAERGEDPASRAANLDRVLAVRPTMTLDDGADLVSILHERRTDLLPSVVGGLTGSAITSVTGSGSSYTVTASAGTGSRNRGYIAS